MAKTPHRGEVKVALHEIDRLVREAAASNAQLDSWIAELAEELRAAEPRLDPAAAAGLAREILEDPRTSLSAQARLDARSVRVLRD